MTNIRFAILVAGFLAISQSSGAQPSSAGQGAATAHEFVQDSVTAGLAILNDVNLTKGQKDTQFRTFLLSLTDLGRIADYTLGPAKQTTSPADLAAFEDAFRRFALATYETEFTKFSGQTLKVVREIPISPNVTMVTTQLIDPHARQRQKPIEVDFRIFGSRGYFSIGDVTVMDVDLAITAQDQFHEFLWQHNDNVRALTAELTRRTDRMTATGLVGDK